MLKIQLAIYWLPQIGGFGIGGFISSGGIVGKEQTMHALRNEDVSLPSATTTSKTCKECGTVLPFKAALLIAL
jgi:hypothetical protein